MLTVYLAVSLPAGHTSAESNESGVTLTYSILSKNGPFFRKMHELKPLSDFVKRFIHKVTWKNGSVCGCSFYQTWSIAWSFLYFLKNYISKKVITSEHSVLRFLWKGETLCFEDADGVSVMDGLWEVQSWGAQRLKILAPIDDHEMSIWKCLIAFKLIKNMTHIH